MLKLFAMSFFFLAAVITHSPLPNQDMEQISKIITQFAAYGDRQDAEAMSQILDETYQAYLNRMFGNTQATTLEKSAYLELLKGKKIGGDEREVNITMIDITGNNALAKVILKGKKMTFSSYLLLAKTEGGDWKIVADMPSLQQ